MWGDMWFQGHALLRAAVATLAVHHGLAGATRVLLAGTSAGAVGVGLNSWVVAAAAPRARLRLLLDSGVFVTSSDYNTSSARQWLRSDLPYVADMVLPGNTTDSPNTGESSLGTRANAATGSIEPDPSASDMQMPPSSTVRVMVRTWIRVITSTAAGRASVCRFLSCKTCNPTESCCASWTCLIVCLPRACFAAG